VVSIADRTQVGLRHVLRAEASDLRPRAQIHDGSGGEDDEPTSDASTPRDADTVNVESALYPFFALALLLVCALEVAWATRKGAA